jgi:S1-C subfamily serine protease
MKRTINAAGLMLLAILSGPWAGAFAAELDAAERAELEAKLEDARARLDAAAAELGELHGKLYAMDMHGSHGRRAMLGVVVGGEGEHGGVRLLAVSPGGGAAAAGLAAGDEITFLGQVDLTAADDPMKALHDALEGVTPGDSVSVGYQREGLFQQADVATQARGVFIMKMAGPPHMDVEIEGLEELEAMGERISRKFEDVDFTTSVQAGAGVHRAIRLGGMLRLEDMGPELASYFNLDGGVLVVSAPGEAGQAGLQGGDVVLSLNGTAVGHAGDVYRALLGPEVEGPVSLEVLRHGGQEVLAIDRESMGIKRPRSISIRSNRPPPGIPVPPPNSL